MINHIRTLLLNRTASSVAAISTGGYTYLDPAYASIALSPDLALVESTLIPYGDSNLKARVECVDALCAVAGSAELRRYFERFDPRVSTPGDVAAGASIANANPVVNLCRTIAPVPPLKRIADAVSDSVPISRIVSSLFTWPVFADDMSELSLVYSSGTEATMRLGAFALAYAYQVERLRRTL